MRIKTVFAFFLLSISTLCTAQRDEIELDPVTVTSSMSMQKASITGRNITVIKGEEFNRLPVQSLDELLRYVPGVEVQSRGAMGAQSDIVIRGGTFQQVLVILDGIRLNDPITGHFNSYIPIAPEEIERIEVLKGASSAIYGSEAVGGVIHVITKSFSKTAAQRPSELGITGKLGEYKLGSSNMGGYHEYGNMRMGGGLLFTKTEGQQQRGTRGFVNNQTGSFSFGQKISERLDLSLRTAIDDRQFSAQNFYTTFVSDTAEERVKTFWNQLRLNYSKNKSNVSFHAGYKTSDDEFRYNSGVSANRNKARLFQSQINYQYEAGEATVITAGGQFQNKVIRSNDRGNHEIDQVAGFVVINQEITNQFFVSPGVRVDWDERGGTELVPQINLSYRLGDFQLRGSAGKTIRHADFTERYNNYNKAYVASGSIGNPDLQAEKSFSYEAGADWFRNSWRISASVFRREQEDVIDWVVTPYSEMPRKENLSATGMYALASNISEVNTSGIETDIQTRFEIADRHHIWTSAGLTWLQSESTGESFYISSHANFLANMNLQLSTPWYGLTITALYKNRDPQEASAIKAKVSREYFVMNAKAEAKLWEGRGGIFLEAYNLFDKNYQDLLGSQMPGRWFVAGMRLHLNNK